MNHLLNVLDGFASALDFAPCKRAYIDPRNGFAKDQQKLRQDVKRIGNDMRKAVDTYGEQNSSCAGYKQKR